MKETPLKTTLSFPVQIHVLKYLTFKYGTCFLYSPASSLAPILRSTISGNGQSSVKSFPSFHYYDVVLTEKYINKSDVIYSKNKIYQFNSDVDNKFREDLYQFMIVNNEIYNIKYKTSFRDFLNRLGITENDIKFETLLKDFQRKRSRAADEKLGTI